MKRTLLFLYALLMAISGAWADGTWNLTSNDYTTDSWETMGENTPDGVKALGSYTACSRTEDIKLTSNAVIEIRFTYTSGDHRLDMLGVDLLDGEDNVIASDYHVGFTGGQRDKNVYVLNNIPAGSYKLRYIIRNYATNSAGNISVFTLKCADSFANISQWYVVRAHSNQSHYMYYNSSNTATGISFTDNTTDINSDKYLWGFVKSGDGVAIYNKEAGSTVAIDNATPSTMSAGGTSVGFAFTYPTSNGTEELGADAFFAIYQTAGTYLNYQNANLQRWTTADAGSTFMLYEANGAETLSYTLTDANGATYSGTYSGVAGWTEPPLTGCAGYSLSNKAWDGTTFTATINFPFAISSNNVENLTYIGSFHNKNGYSSYSFLWHANGTSVIVHDGDVPNNTKSEGVYTDNEKYKWAIYPSISTVGAITFKIKNSSSGYIESTYTGTDGGGHNVGVVSHTASEENATPFTYYSYTGPKYAFKATTTNKYLSVNSVSGDKNQVLGVYSGTHDGTSVAFHTPTDFATLDANLLAARTAFMPYYELLGTEYGQYSGDASSDMSNAYLDTTTPLTAAQITSYTNTLSNPSSKLTLNVPQAGDFLRIKASATNKAAYSTSSDLYLTSSNTQSDVNNNAYKDKRVGFVEGAANDNTTIFYYDGNYLTGFANGLQPVNNTDNQLQIGAVGTSATKITFESIEPTEAKAFRIEFNNGGRSLYTQRYSGVYFTDAAGSDATDAHYRYFLEKVTSLPVTISAAGFATLYAPVALTIPTNVTAYVATVDNGSYLHLEEISGGIIPAKRGVILKGEEGTYDFAITTGGSVEGNMLTGTVAAIERPTGSYILSTGSNDVGFYGDGASTIPGFKSYLQTAESIRGFLGFNFDDPTAISVIEAAMNAGKAIYDLSGRRVENPVSGLYIVNGKKVFINKK